MDFGVCAGVFPFSSGRRPWAHRDPQDQGVSPSLGSLGVFLLEVPPEVRLEDKSHPVAPPEPLCFPLGSLPCLLQPLEQHLPCPSVPVPCWPPAHVDQGQFPSPSWKHSLDGAVVAEHGGDVCVNASPGRNPSPSEFGITF